MPKTRTRSSQYSVPFVWLKYPIKCSCLFGYLSRCTFDLFICCYWRCFPTIDKLLFSALFFVLFSICPFSYAMKFQRSLSILWPIDNIVLTSMTVRVSAHEFKVRYFGHKIQLPNNTRAGCHIQTMTAHIRNNAMAFMWLDRKSTDNAENKKENSMDIEMASEIKAKDKQTAAIGSNSDIFVVNMMTDKLQVNDRIVRFDKRARRNSRQSHLTLFNIFNEIVRSCFVMRFSNFTSKTSRNKSISLRITFDWSFAVRQIATRPKYLHDA